jgi:hypothetical protein
VDRPLDRRTVLRAGSVGLGSAIAGCATIEAEVGLRTQELGRVVLTNRLDTVAEIGVRISRDGTTVLDATYRLAPGSAGGGPQVVLYEWRENPTGREWVVRARRETGEWQSVRLDARRGDRDACSGAAIVVDDWLGVGLVVVPTDCSRADGSED